MAAIMEVANQQQEQSEVITTKANSAQEFSTDLLRVYYGRLFPYDAMFNWLSYGNDPSRPESSGTDRDYFLRREWSFTIEDDIYIRYQSFRDKNEMIAAIQKRQPHKIDIGAVFTATPKDHATIKPELFKTVERELVFDIDMTDYDDIRTCCTGANICRKCWPYMTMALKVVDEALREDFNFQHILWIYSGRRGIHCWVCDPAARALQNDARTAVVEYLTVETGSAENSDKKLKNVFTTPMHPMIKRAYETLEPFFESCIADGKGQGLFARKDRYMKILNSLPNESIRTELYEDWEKNNRMSGAERWRQLKALVLMPVGAAAQAQANKKRSRVNYTELDAWRYELVFTHCYPRLDANVSKSQNHLLKSPFCIHPKTGRVCVPIDPTKAEDFDPFSVPTVRTLCAEVDAFDKEHPNETDVPDQRKTAMQGALDVFETTFMNGLSSTIRKDLKDKADRQAAMMVDF